MDQLHPLREAELVDIFPALKMFMNDDVPEGGGQRKTMIGLKIEEAEAKKNSDRKTKARASLLNGRPSIDIKNALDINLAKGTKNILKQIGSSDDPLRELGPGISSYH